MSPGLSTILGTYSRIVIVTFLMIFIGWVANCLTLTWISSVRFFSHLENVFYTKHFAVLVEKETFLQRYLRHNVFWLRIGLYFVLQFWSRTWIIISAITLDTARRVLNLVWSFSDFNTLGSLVGPTIQRMNVDVMMQLTLCKHNKWKSQQIK